MESKASHLFVHHVFFYLKEDTAENRNKLTEGLLELSKVPQIQLFNIGQAANTNRSVVVRDYSISWLCFFENLNDQEIYQTHPIHLKFIDEYAFLWESVKVFDSN